MTSSLDPWRTLGLPPGSSLDEVRRAYRRLAKANHPDAAGEAALPRFLAIQSAYEALAGPKRGRRPGARPGSSPTDDARRADRERGRAGSAGAAGGAASSRRPAAGSRPGGSRGSGQAGSTSASAASAADGTTGSSPNPGPAGRAGARRRPSNRATPGSTSYDEADAEPFEPGWTGATWYGASSGTYWTINPKEYADPRKHGPEYQRRARRSASGGWIVDDEDGIAPGGADRADDAPSMPGPAGTSESGADGPPRSARAASWGTPPNADDRSTAGAGAEARYSTRSPGTTWPPGNRDPGDHAQPSGDRSSFATQAPPPRGPFARASSTAARFADEGSLAPLLRAPTTPFGRLGLALLGWPPLGVAAANAIGETTGCGRFSASCAEVFSPGTWIVQVAIILLLLALPRLAGWSAVGTLVALAAAVPTAVALSASGGANAPEASSAVLAAVLGLAYALGVGWAIVHRWWRWPVGRRVP